MGGVRVKLLADFLKGGHPGDSKMAVLEDNPCALFLSLFDHPEGDGTLALPEGERAQLSTAKALWKEICARVHRFATFSRWSVYFFLCTYKLYHNFQVIKFLNMNFV